MNIGSLMTAQEHKISLQVFNLRSYVYKSLGWYYNSPGLRPPALQALCAFGMLAAPNGYISSRGSVQGVGYGDQHFLLSDITADQGFGGAVMTLQGGTNRNRNFTARTIITRDRGRFNPKEVEDMKRVGFVDREFESRFEIYSDDQTEARALITPDFMERLMQFDEDYLGRNIQCALIGNQLYICLDIDDRFDFNKTTPLQKYEHIRTIVLHDIASVFIVLELCQRLQNTIGVQTNETMDKERGAYYAQKMAGINRLLETPPQGWQHPPKIDPDMEHTHYLFDGYLGLMVQSIFRPLAPPKPFGS